jgi:hypothetical protein
MRWFWPNKFQEGHKHEKAAPKERLGSLLAHSDLPIIAPGAAAATVWLFSGSGSVVAARLAKPLMHSGSLLGAMLTRRRFAVC